jgi:methylglyoxal reductase
MKYQNIKNTDLELSIVMLGTWVFGGEMWGGAQERECLDAVAAAIDAGINAIDTAPIYGFGVSEKIIGRAIKGRREKLIITTKCGLVGQGKNIRVDLSPMSIQKEIDDSLARLQVDYIDIYQCHWPDPKTPVEKTLDTLCQLKAKGKIRYIGVSNFDAQLLQKALAYTQIVTSQNQYSLLERGIEKDVLPITKGKQIAVITYGALGGGILSGKYQHPKRFDKSDARSFFYKFYEGENFNKTMAFLCKLKEIGRPLNQIAINWVCRQPGVTSAIVGCRNAQQVLDNIAAVDWDLSDENLTYIDSISRNLR